MLWQIGNDNKDLSGGLGATIHKRRLGVRYFDFLHGPIPIRSLAVGVRKLAPPPAEEEELVAPNVALADAAAFASADLVTKGSISPTDPNPNCKEDPEDPEGGGGKDQADK